MPSGVTMRKLSCLMLLLTCGAFAQSDTKPADAPIPVCIATPMNRSFLMVSPAVERDRLVHDINVSAQKKKARVKVNAIAVEGGTLGDAEADARDKECSHVVIWEFRNMDTYSAGTGPMGTNGIGPVVNSRGQTNARTSGVNYRVLRVGSSTQLDDGTIGAPLDSDESSAAMDMVRQLSLRVVHAVLEERPKVQ